MAAKVPLMSIESKSVVIIGGSSGIGLAIAGDVAIRTVDVADKQSVRKLFSEVGGIDHLVVTGSSVKTGALHELSPADARAAMDGKSTLPRPPWN
jgi:NAD(P)-dependent dehydrogenase (short-subunit alcohol dehydrogenase family)